MVPTGDYFMNNGNVIKDKIKAEKTIFEIDF